MLLRKLVAAGVGSRPVVFVTHRCLLISHYFNVYRNFCFVVLYSFLIKFPYCWMSNLSFWNLHIFVTGNFWNYIYLVVEILKNKVSNKEIQKLKRMKKICLYKFFCRFLKSLASKVGFL